MAAVLRYTDATYGDAFADVYDDWYQGVSDVDATCELVVELLPGPGGDRRGRVLELGAGTGRLAVPLAERGLEVTALDASAAMLERLRQRDGAGRVRLVHGDMVADAPAGPFDVVLVAYNTLFNLLSAERQAACFDAVAARLAPDGALLVEAFVPADPPPTGSAVELRSMTADEVVLSVVRHTPEEQRAEGQFVHLAAGEPVRLRPWAIRYSPPAELDAMARRAGFVLRARWEDVARRPFDEESERHVSVYRLGPGRASMAGAPAA